MSAYRNGHHVNDYEVCWDTSVGNVSVQEGALPLVKYDIAVTHVAVCCSLH